MKEQSVCVLLLLKSMNVARSHSLPFSCYCSINMAVARYGLVVGEATPEQGALHR
jgi:hypothetical protein